MALSSERTDVSTEDPATANTHQLYVLSCLHQYYAGVSGKVLPGCGAELALFFQNITSGAGACVQTELSQALDDQFGSYRGTADSLLPTVKSELRTAMLDGDYDESKLHDLFRMYTLLEYLHLEDTAGIMSAWFALESFTDSDEHLRQYWSNANDQHAENVSGEEDKYFFDVGGVGKDVSVPEDLASLREMAIAIFSSSIRAGAGAGARTFAGARAGLVPS